MSNQMGVRLDEPTRAVLESFDKLGGFGTTGYPVDESGRSRPTVTKRLDRLKAADHIEYAHRPTALWRLIDDPRDTEQSDAGD